jgi:hypothetical protein
VIVFAVRTPLFGVNVGVAVVFATTARTEYGTPGLNASGGTVKVAVIAFAVPATVEVTRSSTLAIPIFMFERSVAVVPSSTAFWPDSSQMNWARTAAMTVPWRHTLFSWLLVAVPEVNPLARSDVNAA